MARPDDAEDIRPADSMRLFLILLVSLAPCLGAEPTFVGLLKSRGVVRAAFVDPAGRSSDWLMSGAMVSGYRIFDISLESERVTMGRNGVLVDLPLRGWSLKRTPAEIAVGLDRALARTLHELMMTQVFAQKGRALRPELFLQVAFEHGRTVVRREQRGKDEIVLVGIAGRDETVAGKDLARVVVRSPSGSGNVVWMFR